MYIHSKVKFEFEIKMKILNRSSFLIRAQITINHSTPHHQEKLKFESNWFHPNEKKKKKRKVKEAIH